MPDGMDGERFIQQICDESFFADYVFRNPRYLRGRTPQELCDALVLFNDVAVLIEVKTADDLRHNGATYDKVVRWAEKKKQKSIRQLTGAIRAIKHGLIQSVTNERRGIVSLRPDQISDFYGIIILDHPFQGLIGGDLATDGASREIVINCNFREFKLLCEELSTLGDFIDYLEFRSAIFGKVEFHNSTELDLLPAFKTNRDICEGAAGDHVSKVIVKAGEWSKYEGMRWRQERQIADRNSWILDRIVQGLHLSFRAEPGEDTKDAEQRNDPATDYVKMLDYIAQLRRFERAEIGRKLHQKSRLYVKTRRLRYFCYWRAPLPLMVFLISDNRSERVERLSALVPAAQIKMKANRAIGVAINSHESPTGSSVWYYSEEPWEDLVEDDTDGELRRAVNRLFKSAIHERRDEWDATSAGRIRAKSRRREERRANPPRPKRYKQRKRKSR